MLFRIISQIKPHNYQFIVQNIDNKLENIYKELLFKN